MRVRLEDARRQRAVTATDIDDYRGAREIGPAATNSTISFVPETGPPQFQRARPVRPPLGGRGNDADWEAWFREGVQGSRRAMALMLLPDHCLVEASRKVAALTSSAESGPSARRSGTRS